MALDYGPLDSGVDLEKFKRMKDRDFPPGSQARVTFEELCRSGCDPRLLFSFLTLTVFSALRQKTIYGVHGVSRSALVKLPERLERVSRELESVNPLFLHYVQANFIENPSLPSHTRSRWRQQATVYRTTPKLLRLLAGHLRVANIWLNDNFGPRRFDTLRSSVIELVDYVDTYAKGPHYEEVSDLLVHLFSVHEKAFQRIANRFPQPERTGARKKKRDTPPKLLSSPDALKALYRRSAKYGFRKTRLDHSKPSSA